MLTNNVNYRNVLGGLDNAVAQAEARSFEDLFIVDLDCHIYEPFSSFSHYLPEKWRAEYSDAKILDESESYKEDYLRFVNDQTNDIDPLKLKLLKFYKDVASQSARQLFDRKSILSILPEIPVKDKSPSGMSKEIIVDTFVNRMRDIGIKRSVIFPNTLLTIGSYHDHDFEVAVSNAFIDFMIDEFLDKYEQLLTCIVVPANSPDRAADLIDRVGSEKGVIGAMITAQRPTLAGDESWLPIYEAARRKNLPICFHGSQSPHQPFDQMKSWLAYHAVGFPINIILQLTSLITSGMVERFPELKFVFIEGGINWIPWLMYRLDSCYLMLRNDAPLLKKLPSEYIKEFYYSSQPFEKPLNQDLSSIQWIFKSFDAENQLMYASDYPHFDFDVPSVIDKIPFLSLDGKKKILGENARRLFKLS